MSLALDLKLMRPDFALTAKAELPTKGFTALCGPPGCGKTLLLRCLAGLEQDVRGKLSFHGEPWLSGSGAVPPELRGIGYVFQDSRLFPYLNVRQNLEFAFKRRFQNQGPELAQVSEWLELDSLLDHPIARLSAGEQKRVAIARCLLFAPRLILMDAPLSGVDSAECTRLLSFIEQLPTRLQVPVIYACHSHHEVFHLTDRLLLMESGQIEAQGCIVALSHTLDSPLVRLDDAATIVAGKLAEHDSSFNLSCVHLESTYPFWLQHMTLPLGTEVRIQVPARDVSVTLKPATQSSILNILPCFIDSIDDSDENYALLRLRLGRQYLLAKISRKSFSRMGLRRGQSVFAQIKTATPQQARRSASQ